MLNERNFNIGNFCKLTTAGLQVAEFVDIRTALINRYKAVYGSDIDLSTASADGVFVNDIAVIMNNILQTMKSLYSNLDVNSASGVYLDNLCRLSNVIRKSATKSTASLVVTSLFTSGEPVVFGDKDGNDNILNRLTFIDNSGTEWVANASITLGPRESKEITVTCSEFGPVDAPAGWISQTMLAMNLSVSQPNNAILGETQESDTQLRARRAQSSGADGVTVLESLIGALLEISGINDVRIYNNNSLFEQTALDSTKISAHSVYVIIRQTEGLNIDDSIIGELIYNKLTPGIKTVQSSAASTNGELKQYEFIPQLLNVAVTFLSQMVYWKKAIPIHPTITIKITPTNNFVETEFDDIFESVTRYTDNILISESIDASQVFMSVFEADPTFKGQRTYSVLPSNVTVANTANPDTYYKYTTKSFVKNSDNTYTLTIA